MVKNVEGIASKHVPDSTKIVCPRCNSTLLYLSSTMDDPIDITKDEAFAALMICATGGSFQGLVALCHNCGNEFVPLWYIIDTGAADGGAITMGDLDSNRDDSSGANAVANLLAGLYMIYLGDDANDNNEYFIIATNTAAAPVVITPTVAPNDLSDGEWMITNILPLGKTPAE